MSHRLMLSTLLLIISLCTPLANAIPIVIVTLPNLTRDADLIVVSTIISVRQEGTISITVRGIETPARRMVATLNVHRVIKGSVNGPSLSFEFVMPNLPAGYVEIAPMQVGMFFLRATMPQRYALLNPYYPFLTAYLDAPITEGNALDRVTTEIAFSLTAPQTSAEERRRIIILLSRVETSVATAALERAVTVLDRELRLMVAGVLLSRNNLLLIRLAEDALMHPPPDVNRDILRGLAGGVSGVRDAQAISFLTRLLSSPDVHTRRGASSALRHTGTDAVIEPLTRALDDSDREVRYNAVLGLAIATEQYEWGASVDLFEREEQRYLNYWREWARTR